MAGTSPAMTGSARHRHESWYDPRFELVTANDKR
jgi:hypothetical protein